MSELEWSRDEVRVGGWTLVGLRFGSYVTSESGLL